MTVSTNKLILPNFYLQIKRLVGVQIIRQTGDPVLADDIIQDVAEEILNKLDRNPDATITLPLLHWIARMKLVDHFRKTLGRDSGGRKKRTLADSAIPPPYARRHCGLS